MARDHHVSLSLQIEGARSGATPVARIDFDRLQLIGSADYGE